MQQLDQNNHTETSEAVEVGLFTLGFKMSFSDSNRNGQLASLLIFIVLLSPILPFSPLYPNRSRQMFSHSESGSEVSSCQKGVFPCSCFLGHVGVSLKLKPEEFGLEPALCVKCLEITLL